MPRTCTVCRHEKHEAIDAAIVAGNPYRRIASQHGLTEAAVRRHKLHLPAQVAKAHDAREITRADDLLASVQRLRQKLETALEATSVARDIAALAREARETARLLLEVEGRLKQGSQVQVNVALVTTSEWISLREQIMAVLERHPEAKKDVLAALRGAEDAQAVLNVQSHSTGQRAPSAAIVVASAAPGSGTWMATRDGPKG